MVIQLNCNIQLCICRTQSVGRNRICEASWWKQPFSLSKSNRIWDADFPSQWKESLSAVCLNNNTASTAFPRRHTTELKLSYIFMLLYYSKVSLTSRLLYQTCLALVQIVNSNFLVHLVINIEWNCTQILLYISDPQILNTLDWKSFLIFFSLSIIF